MPAFPGPANGTTFVQSNLSPLSLEKPGDSAYVFGVLAAGASQLPVNDTNAAFETIAGASLAVQLPAAENAGPPAVSVEISFNGAPGAGESIVIQEADTHADAFFLTPAAPAYTVTTFSANNVARVDLSPTGGKFLRVNRTAGANAAPIKVKITRLG